MPITLIGAALAAQLSISSAYYFGHLGGYQTSGSYAPIEYKVVEKTAVAHTDSGRNLGTTWGGLEAKVSYKLSTALPLFESQHPLLKFNHVGLSAWGELSPVSANAGINSAWELVPFAKVNLGGTTGTGWNMVVFNGLGRNFPWENAVRQEPFSGLVNKFWFEPALQFDFAAIFPGEWNHVIVYAAESREYREYTNASQNTAWEFENDGGTSLNGWKRNRTFLLGYNASTVIQTVGFLTNSEKHITHEFDSLKSKQGWGSDFETWSFGPLAKIKTGNSYELTTLLQWRTDPGYTNDSIGNRHFFLRRYNRAVTHLHRLAINLTRDL